jgi:AcrR family transcriptional regulator
MIGDVSSTGPANVTERRPGRPRDARADEAILAAAGEVLAELGVAGFSVDAVAARARVGKATIYRRWASRAELLLETAHLATPVLPDPDTGSVREDLVVLTVAMAEKFRDTVAGKVLPAVAAEAAVNPEMRATLSRFVCERRQRAMTALRRGIERGELPADIDMELALDLGSGPVFIRMLFTDQPVDRPMIESTIDIVLAGLRASG